MDERAEVIVAGAGIAGLSLATLLGRQGIDVLVIDRTPAPRDRVCGEGVMPMGMAVLREIGIDPEAMTGHDFRGLEFATTRQRHAIDFCGARGRGIRRTVLIEALERTARVHPSVRIERDVVLAPIEEQDRIHGVRGRVGRYRASWVVAADGAHSPLMRAAGVSRQERGYRMGLRQHFVLPCPHRMERVWVGLFPPFDVYVTPVGGRDLLVTTMCDREAYRRVLGRYRAFLERTPFAPLLEGAQPASPLLGWHQPLFRPERFAPRGMLAVGDAGGGIDPCLGMGMSFALASAHEAARAISATLRQPGAREAQERAFEAWRAALFRHYNAFDRVFRVLVTSRAGSEALLWGMRHWPQIAEGLTDIVAQCRPWRGFPWGALLRPVVG
jgi:flavin-dependent dehydrogenase